VDFCPWLGGGFLCTNVRAGSGDEGINAEP